MMGRATLGILAILDRTIPLGIIIRQLYSPTICLSYTNITLYIGEFQ